LAGILTVTHLWNSVGFGSIVYLAGILAIDTAYFEAAKIDGANKWQQIRYITLPLLLPLVIILVLLSIGRIFNADFGLFYFVPRNTPQLYSTTDVIDTFVYRSLVQLGDISMAAAAGFYQSIVGFVLVVLANWIVRRINQDYSLF
jgi:putative aldouronate transport system permease protein